MSFPELRVHTTGKLVCSFYTFLKAGDELPEHAHEEADNHVTWVVKGPFKVYGDGWEQIHDTGAFLDWEVGQMHGFISMVDGGKIVNTLKNT